MGKKNFLKDLYVLGKEVEFDTPGGPQRVWLQKLNAAENERAIRTANAARARVLLEKRDPDSTDSVALRLQVAEFDTEAAVAYLLQPRVRELTEQIEARLELEEEWSADGYLQGLRDAWNDGVRDVWVAGDDDLSDEQREEFEKAEKVYNELARFREAVDAQLEEQSVDLQDEYVTQTDAEMRDNLYDRLYEAMGDMTWMDTYQRAQIQLAVRDDEDRTQIFDSVEELDTLQDAAYMRLLQEYRAVTVEPQEGKDSQETPSS